MGRGAQSSKNATNPNMGAQDIFTKPGLHEMQSKAGRMPRIAGGQRVSISFFTLKINFGAF